MLSAEAGPRDRVLLQLLYAAGLARLRSLRLALAQSVPARRCRPDHGVRKERPHSLHRIARAAVVGIDRLRGQCGCRGPGVSVTERQAPGPWARPVIVRRAAKRAGVAEAISPHWLRHAHASHALDHGAPIHLVQATLGHSSVATTSSYLHARPGDSSARFLALERFSPESCRIALPLPPTGVMDVMTAKQAAKEKTHMATFTIDMKTTSRRTPKFRRRHRQSAIVRNREGSG